MNRRLPFKVCLALDMAERASARFLRRNSWSSDFIANNRSL